MNENKYWILQKDCGLSNQQAADYLEMGISTIKRYRNGKKTPPISVIRDLTALSKKVKKGAK
jgi:ribosome-binding protein aMBF1 (putative translation factor)